MGQECRPGPGGPRAALRAERESVLAAVTALTSELEGFFLASESSNADDEHDPEGTTIAYERAQVLALLRQARTRLGDVDGALARLAAGTYGGCERCGEPIGAERLAARPAARMCVTCARAVSG